MGEMRKLCCENRRSTAKISYNLSHLYRPQVKSAVTPLRPSARRTLRDVSAAFLGVIVATVMIATVLGNGLLAPSPTVVLVPTGVAVLPAEVSGVNLSLLSSSTFKITFVVSGQPEVESLLTKLKPYIHRGDVFDLLAGGKTDPSVRGVDKWAEELHAAYPWATIYVHVSGISRYRDVAKSVGPDIAGVTYDYEAHYEPEFSYNFEATEKNFRTVADIATEYGIQSVGYPTGIPLLKAYLSQYDWNYATLARIVDVLDIQTQLFCQKSPTDYARAVSVVLAQYAAAGRSGSATFQITIGGTESTLPHAVSAAVGFACAQELESLGVHTLYVWWQENSLSSVAQFLKDLSNAKLLAPAVSQPSAHQDLVDGHATQYDLTPQPPLLREPEAAVQRESAFVGGEHPQL